MILKKLEVGPLQANCYIMGDENTGNALVIDPGGDTDLILEVLKDEGLKVSKILCTHGHPDHVGGAYSLAEAAGAPVCIHAEDSSFYGLDADCLLSDGEEIAQDSIALKVIHTPGHTPGSVCFLCGSRLFTGDTLFAGSVGRTDFPGGNTRQLMESLAKKIAGLPPGTEVFPGHGESTRLEWELEGNPYLQGIS
ncbi:MAG: MBL fold metallo-hydrolase [Chloroflexi bacterium]|nr:MBL fold metallo-hydrolase [Chloroflexota bacterium]